jgi:hypothetical protein
MKVKLLIKLAFMFSLSAVESVLAQEPAQGPVTLPQQALDLRHLFGLLSSQNVALRKEPATKPDAVARGLAKVKAHSFASADYPGADESIVLDISNGTALGTFQYSATSSSTAFIFKGTSYTTFVVPGAKAAVLAGEDNLGFMVGSYVDASATHGFIYENGTVITNHFPGASQTLLWDIADSSLDGSPIQVGSFAYSDGIMHGFWHNSSGIFGLDFPGAVQTEALGVNASGAIVGTWFDNAGSAHGFLFSGNNFIPLGFPLATQTEAFGINDSGDIAGLYFDASGNEHGFVFSRGTWNEVDVAGAARTALTRIKNNGVITGLFVDQIGEIHGLIGR